MCASSYFTMVVYHTPIYIGSSIAYEYFTLAVVNRKDFGLYEDGGFLRYLIMAIVYRIIISAVILIFARIQFDNQLALFFSLHESKKLSV